jgi:ribosomal protein L7/L12
VTDRAERAEQNRLLTEMARSMLASGANVDQLANKLFQRTDSPISVIKAVVNATGMGLGDAKWVVHRNLDPKVREAAESLWDDLLDGDEATSCPHGLGRCRDDG